MKLLILTQKVNINDDILGFFHDWIKEFAKHCERVTVVCLEKGEYDLPGNVRVLSLGKKSNIKNQISKIKYLINFYKYIWRFRKDYDAVFVHMNPEYIVLGGLAWRLMGKKIGLWYTHKSVDLKLRIAEKFSNIIFTASQESFRLKSKKVEIIGHGIDVCKFAVEKNPVADKFFRIIQIGRISPIKNQMLLVEAVKILVDEIRELQIKVDFYGPATNEKDEQYKAKINKFIKENKLDEIISFKGGVPNHEIPSLLSRYDLSINLSPTGGMDKAVLESMTASVPILVSNETFKNDLSGYLDYCFIEKLDTKEIANKIKILMKMDGKKKEGMAEELLKRAQNRHSLSNLISSIIKKLDK